MDSSCLYLVIVVIILNTFLACDSSFVATQVPIAGKLLFCCVLMCFLKCSADISGGRMSSRRLSVIVSCKTLKISSILLIIVGRRHMYHMCGDQRTIVWILSFYISLAQPYSHTKFVN